MATKEPWQMSASTYLQEIGVHEPWIAEISPMQMASMGKQQKAAYEKKRSQEWDASANAKEEWRNKIVAAYDEGRITLESIELHPEAKRALELGLRLRSEEAGKVALEKAHKANRINNINELSIGDRVWSIMYGRYGTVTKKFPKSVRLELEGGPEVTEQARALQWKKHDDVKAHLADTEKVRSETAAKEPWQMTLRQYLKFREQDLVGTNAQIPELYYRNLKPEHSRKMWESTMGKYHKEFVQEALAQGKPVPTKALADYPDLKPISKVARAMSGTWVFEKRPDNTPIMGKRYRDLRGQEWQIVGQNDLNVAYASKVVRGKVQKKRYVADETHVASLLAETIKPTKYGTTGMIEGETPSGLKISLITKGTDKGKWRTVVGKTEFVGLTKESTAELAQRELAKPEGIRATAYGSPLEDVKSDLVSELWSRVNTGKKLPVGVQATMKSIRNHIDGMPEHMLRDWHDTLFGSKVKTEAAKESWQMSQAEFLKREGIKRSSSHQKRSRAIKFHERLIEDAIKEGKKVPFEVISAYPYLAKEAGYKTKAPSGRGMRIEPVVVKGKAETPTTTIQITRVQSKRSDMAQRVDQALLAAEVVPIEQAEKWLRQPNRYDIAGVDTPGGTIRPSKPSRPRRPKRIRPALMTSSGKLVKQRRGSILR